MAWFCYNTPTTGYCCRLWDIPSIGSRVVGNSSAVHMMPSKVSCSRLNLIMLLTEDSFLLGSLIVALKAAAVLGPRVHRDVSPSNIILCTDRKSGTSNPRRGYLCDWDLSRAGAKSEGSSPQDESEGQSTLREDYEVSVCELLMRT